MDTDDLNDLMEFALFALVGYAAHESQKRSENKSEEEKSLKADSEDTSGVYASNYIKTQENNPDEFMKLTRMTPKTFELLMTLVEPELEKKSWRKSITPRCRLFITLQYLSQGTSRHILVKNFRICHSTILRLIYETADVLWEILQPLYMSPPTDENWKEIAQDFQNLCNLPNCVSAIDRRRILTRCENRGGTCHFRKVHVIEVMAACDAEYIFTSIDIERNDHESDKPQGIESSFRNTLLNRDPNLPAPTVLPNSRYVCNYFFAGNSKFPLRTYLMLPYPGRLLDGGTLIFNKRISRAQRIIENAFGIVLAKWRILETTMNALPDNAERLVKACFVLHNFCKLHESMYCPKEYIDEYNDDDEIVHKGIWRCKVRRLRKIRAIDSSNASSDAFEMRDTLRDYLARNTN